jgi:hypothetical protein
MYDDDATAFALFGQPLVEKNTAACYSLFVHVNRGGAHMAVVLHGRHVLQYIHPI